MKINEYNFYEESKDDIKNLNKDFLNIKLCKDFSYKYRGKQFIINSYGRKNKANLVGYFNNGDRAYPVFADYANNFDKSSYIRITDANKKNYNFLIPINKGINKLLFGKLIDIVIK